MLSIKLWNTSYNDLPSGKVKQVQSSHMFPFFLELKQKVQKFGNWKKKIKEQINTGNIWWEWEYKFKENLLRGILGKYSVCDRIALVFVVRNETKSKLSELRHNWNEVALKRCNRIRNNTHSSFKLMQQGTFLSILFSFEYLVHLINYGHHLVFLSITNNTYLNEF